MVAGEVEHIVQVTPTSGWEECEERTVGRDSVCVLLSSLQSQGLFPRMGIWTELGVERGVKLSGQGEGENQIRGKRGIKMSRDQESRARGICTYIFFQMFPLP